MARALRILILPKTLHSLSALCATPTTAVLAWLRLPGARPVTRSPRLSSLDVERVPSRDLLRRFRHDRRVEVAVRLESRTLRELVARCRADGGDPARTIARAIECFVDSTQPKGVERRDAEKRNATAGAQGGVSEATSFQEAHVSIGDDSSGVQPPSTEGTPAALPQPALPPLAQVLPIRPSIEPAAWTQPGRTVTVSELRDILKAHAEFRGVLAFDEYKFRAAARREPPWGKGVERSWTDVDSQQLRAWVYDTFRSGASPDVVEAAVSIVADDNKYHSLAEELRSYRPQWDETPRVARWLENYCGVSASKLTESISVRFLVSAVARALSPGCKADHVLVLEGPTGCYKSSAVSALAGAKHYSDSPIDLASARDAPMKLCGVWMQEFPEMSFLSQHRPDVVKAFISRRRDDFIPKYGRHPVCIERSCVFVGTVESGRYLTGSTNRRFWPVFVCSGEQKKIDTDAIDRDRVQLLAEAVSMYDAGVNWWMDTEDEALATNSQELRRDDDSWEEPVTEYISAHWSSIKQRGFVTIPDILSKALHLKAGVWKKKDEMRVSDILIRAKWHKGDRCRDEGKRVVPWRFPGGVDVGVVGVDG